MDNGSSAQILRFYSLLQGEAQVKRTFGRDLTGLLHGGFHVH